MRWPPRHLVFAWLALVFFLGSNIAIAYLVGATAAVFLANLVVAAVMAFIVLAIFMELGRRRSLLWAFAGAGFFWLAIMFCLTATDYLTRYSYAPS